MVPHKGKLAVQAFKHTLTAGPRSAFRFARDDMAALQTNKTLNAVLTVIIVLSIIGATAQLIMFRLGDTVNALEDTSTNSTVADSLRVPLVLLLAVTVLLGIIALVIRATGGKGKL